MERRGRGGRGRGEVTQITREAKKTLKHRRALLQGNEAVVEGALAAR